MSLSAAVLTAEAVSEADRLTDATLADAEQRRVIEYYLAGQGLPPLAQLPLAEQRHYARQLALVQHTAEEDARAAVAAERPQLHDRHVACLLANAEVVAGIGRFTELRLGLPLTSFVGEERERLLRAMFSAGDLRLVPGKGGIVAVEFPTLDRAMADEDDFGLL